MGGATEKSSFEIQEYIHVKSVYFLGPYYSKYKERITCTGIGQKQPNKTIIHSLLPEAENIYHNSSQVHN